MDKGTRNDCQIDGLEPLAAYESISTHSTRDFQISEANTKQNIFVACAEASTFSIFFKFNFSLFFDLHTCILRKIGIKNKKLYKISPIRQGLTWSPIQQRQWKFNQKKNKILGKTYKLDVFDNIIFEYRLCINGCCYRVKLNANILCEQEIWNFRTYRPVFSTIWVSHYSYKWLTQTHVLCEIISFRVACT